MADNSTPLQRANKAALRPEKERMRDMRQGSMAPEKERMRDMRQGSMAPEKERMRESFSEGGMIRGCNDSQIGGKKFSGTY